MEIYVDVVVFENTIINLFLLLMTAKLLRFQYRLWGLYLASFIGGMYTLVLFTNYSILSSFVIKVGVAAIMIYLSTRINCIMNGLKAILIFFLLSFSLSGICFAIAMAQNSYVVGQAIELQSYSIKWLLLALMAFYILVTRITDYLRDRAVIKNFIYDIYINAGEKTLLLKGFLDSGNELREPATNLPCIIIEEKYLSELTIPENEKYSINYKTISESGNMYGFKGKEIRIRNHNKSEWVSVDAIICGCSNKLSTENDYQVLLSRGVI